MPKVVVFTGAGVSADSGISTFRDSDGLWENYRIEDVCTAEAIVNNRPTVIDFYNQRRRDMLSKEPNAAHYAIADLEKHFDTQVVTQNVDNLHERAGSTSVIHLHGELTKLRSSKNPNLIVDIEGWKQELNDTASDGSLLRPHIVFFGEAVPMFEVAAQTVLSADILIIVGTSLAVYPAASLVQYVKDHNVPIYIVDPSALNIRSRNPITHIQQRAVLGMPALTKQIIEQFNK